jgi:hypothetical protein
MGIKTSIKLVKEVKGVKKETPFPKLMVSKETGVIVLFKNSQLGVVAAKGNSDHIVGDECSDWYTPNFVDYIIGDSEPEEIIEEKELPFPKLMIAKDGRAIIAFSKPKVGIVVYVTEESNLRIDYSGKYWGMNHFEDFKGELIVKNEEV